MRFPRLRGALILAFVLGLLSLLIQPAAASMSVTYSLIATGTAVNLTQQGSLDWVHWGLFNEGSVDRKAGVAPLIGAVEAAGGVGGVTFIYQYSDNFNGYSWSDGTPDMAVTNSTTGIWAYSTPADGSGFRF